MRCRRWACGGSCECAGCASPRRGRDPTALKGRQFTAGGERSVTPGNWTIIKKSPPVGGGRGWAFVIAHIIYRCRKGLRGEPSSHGTRYACLMNRGLRSFHSLTPVCKLSPFQGFCAAKRMGHMGHIGHMGQSPMEQRDIRDKETRWQSFVHVADQRTLTRNGDVPISSSEQDCATRGERQSRKF